MIDGAQNSVSPAGRGSWPSPLWLAAGLNLALAVMQLALFAPGVASGQAIQAGGLYRVDGLSLVFGVGWTLAGTLLAAGLALGERAPERDGRLTLALCLLALGLLQAVYSLPMLGLWVGWEVAGLGLWFAVSSPGTTRLLLLSLSAPGWPLLLLALLGLAPAFAPPAGGSAQAWPVPVVLAFGVAVLARSGCWPFNGWPRVAALAIDRSLLVALYSSAAPFLLAKAMVAARWDAGGIWLLVLLSTLGLAGAATSAYGYQGPARAAAIASTFASTAAIGFALAPGSALGAAGATALVLAGALWAGITACRRGLASTAALLLGGALGVWAVTQAALSTRYGLVAAVLLPAWGLAALGVARSSARDPGRGKWAAGVLTFLGVGILALAAIFPQAAADWVLRPAVGAMAGGVGALTSLGSEWGIGLVLRSADETALAALPATGIALALGLALVALYWLSRLLGRFATSEVAPQEAGEDAEGMDGIVPGAEAAGHLLDPMHVRPAGGDE